MKAATITADRPALWSSLPGWGIAANLIPPELINARQLKHLRRLMALGIVALLILCAGGYYLAARENFDATSDLVSVQGQTSQLHAEGGLYSGVVSIQGSVSQVQGQIAQLMSGDVDVVALMAELRSNLPTTMTITQETITISPAGVAGAAGTASGSAGGSGLDTSGLPRIGTVTMSGSGHTLDDLSDYIDRLHQITGLVDILPVSNTVSAAKSSTQFTLTMGLTTALLSHRFDLAGTK